MNMEMVLGLLRHLLTFAGGYLVSTGHLTEVNVEQIIGAIMTIVGALWSVRAKVSTPSLPTKGPSV